MRVKLGDELDDPRPVAPPVESDEQSQRCAHQREHDRPYDPQCFECEVDALCETYTRDLGDLFADWQGIAWAYQERIGGDPEDVLADLRDYPLLVLAIADLPRPMTGIKPQCREAYRAVDAALRAFRIAAKACREANR